MRPEAAEQFEKWGRVRVRPTVEDAKHMPTFTLQKWPLGCSLLLTYTFARVPRETEVTFTF